MKRIMSNNFRKWKTICLMMMFASVVFAQKTDNLKPSASNYLLRNEFKLKQSEDLNEQYSLLIGLTKAAFVAGETEKAQTYAEELVSVADKLHSKYPKLPSSLPGRASHISNIILGRIALEKGETSKAKEYLLAAGNIPATVPELMSFGPDMNLAKQLLEKGEKETVIQYFDLCAKFWQNNQGKLASWKQTVEQGGMPNFGANLNSINSWRFDGR